MTCARVAPQPGGAGRRKSSDAGASLAVDSNQAHGMRVRIDIGLDLDGIHTFQWEPSDAAGAVEIPRTTLDRWTAEREAFHVAYLRWKRVSEEIEETLYRASDARGAQTARPAEAEQEPEVSLAAVVRATKARNR